MSNQELSNQLIKRIVFNLGILSGQGLCHPANILKKKLRLQDEESKIESFDVYGAECVLSDSPVKISCVNIGSENSYDLVLAIKQDDTVIAIRDSDGEFESGSILIRYNSKWVDMDVLHQLNLAAAIEMITQNGLPWTPVMDQEDSYSVIAAILSED